MLFKMMMDASSHEEKPVVRGFLKHLIFGFSVGVAVGTIMLMCLLLSLKNMDLGMPWIWALAMILQCGPIGGLIGIGVYVSRITTRDEDDEDDQGGPGGNAAEETADQIVVRPAGHGAGTLKPSKA